MEYSGKLTVGVLRELLRNLQQWRSLYESEGVDTLTGPDGRGYSLHDLEYLYSNLSRLPKRQAQAITLYLVQGMREVDAAVAMGLSPSNPIGIYASVGLKRLLGMIEEGQLPRWHARNGLSV
jgi:DNA-directed RNA polymerase specialized sigma24 family protein